MCSVFCAVALCKVPNTDHARTPRTVQFTYRLLLLHIHMVDMYSHKAMSPTLHLKCGLPCLKIARGNSPFTTKLCSSGTKCKIPVGWQVQVAVVFQVLEGVLIRINQLKATLVDDHRRTDVQVLVGVLLPSLGLEHRAPLQEFAAHNPCVWQWRLEYRHCVICHKVRQHEGPLSVQRIHTPTLNTFPFP